MPRVTTRSASGANNAMFSSGTTVSVVRMHAHPIAIASISLSAGDDAFDNARQEGEMPEDVVTRAHREPALFNAFIERAVADVVGGASVLFTVKNTGVEPGEHAEDVALGRLLAESTPLEGLFTAQ
ncbi:hypothetical protein RI054_10g54600 [Pseudoscourfieldia marina]